MEVGWIIGLTALNAVQGGADPATDAAEGFLLADLGGDVLGEVAAEGLSDAGGEIAAETGETATTTGSDAAESCLNSFTGDTPVAMADGTTKPIKDVAVGDRVLATDPETGQTNSEPVVQLIRHSGHHTMILISLADGSVLDSTDGHPIWDATTHRFTEAGHLRAGEQIETADGSLIAVAGLTTYSANLTAYNLQIDQIHTYYAGVTPVLVHNSCDEAPRVLCRSYTGCGSRLRVA